MTERPKTRGDCVNGPRPCPWISCRHHLALDVLDSGAIRWNTPPGLFGADFADDTLTDVLLNLPETCSLDVADRGEHEQTEIAKLLGDTPVEVWRVKARALDRLRAARRRLPLVSDMASETGAADGLAYGGSPDECLRDEPAALTLYQLSAPAGDEELPEDLPC